MMLIRLKKKKEEARVQSLFEKDAREPLGLFALCMRESCGCE